MGQLATCKQLPIPLSEYYFNSNIDHPTDPRLSFTKQPPTLYSANWMQSITVPSILSPKPHILPTTVTCMLSSAGPRYIFVAIPTGSRSSIRFCQVKPLSSLVTIATPICITSSSRYTSPVTPKANSSFGRLSFQFTAANDWNELQKSLKLETYISLTLSTSCQSSLRNNVASFLALNSCKESDISRFIIKHIYEDFTLLWRDVLLGFFTYDKNIFF